MHDETHDEPFVMEERVTIEARDGFTPHSDLCRAFAIGRASYQRDLATMTGLYRTLLTALQGAPDAPTRQGWMSKFSFVCEDLLSLRGEMNAWYYANALACPQCGATLFQSWPLTEIVTPNTAKRRQARDQADGADGADEAPQLSETLRRELRRRRAGQTPVMLS